LQHTLPANPTGHFIYSYKQTKFLNVLTAATTGCVTGIITGRDHPITLDRNMFMQLHNVTSFRFSCCQLLRTAGETLHRESILRRLPGGEQH